MPPEEPRPLAIPFADAALLARLAISAPAWLPPARLAWLVGAIAALPLAPSVAPRSHWRHACCRASVAALLLPAEREAAWVAGLLGPEVAARWGEQAALAEAPSCAAEAAAWLLAHKRMRAPLATQDPPLVPERLARLRLDAEGLVAAIAGLGDAVAEGRRLARAALETEHAARRRR